MLVDNGYPVSGTCRLRQPPLTGPTRNQASALPPRIRERGGQHRPKWLYEPLGTRGQWPSPSAPGGRELVSHPSRRLVACLQVVPWQVTSEEIPAGTPPAQYLPYPPVPTVYFYFIFK